MSRLISVSVVAVSLFVTLPAFGQQPTRIQFGKGKSSAVVQGTTGNYGKSYVVRARGGQKVILVLTPRAGVGVRVETIGTYGHQLLLREERGGTYEVGLEEAGDLTIFIGSKSGKNSEFTLTLKIVKMTDI